MGQKRDVSEETAAIRSGSSAPSSTSKEVGGSKSADERELAVLSDEELGRIDEKLKLRPLAIYEIVREEGVQELARPVTSLWWSGLTAGLSIGFSILTEATLRSALPDSTWAPLIANWGYSVGFLIVILGRQQLFTEITLTAVLPVLANPSLRGVWAVMRLWTIVLAANLVGTIVFGAGIALDVMHRPEVTQAALELSREAMAHSWVTILLRAMAAGWLMATIGWLLPSSEGSPISIIVLMTYLIALLGLSHIVAGSVEAVALVVAGEQSLRSIILGFYLPCLAGNAIGGSALFALISYAQVKREIEETAAEGRRSEG
ncbi:formate/nitrite transporter family protein [Consotaella salsifontis]|uniref:Formate/nitrite transporter FocA, FNT family n=1 Tax=Consotaella salsifontis TaxID=1365950 RepID=A0A1T4SZY0_9HYPH|nr:formate/nitrite transporter family protein [Consotaella salsifontis]SKA33780.1 Formate/nitrite transporter FocA, FNT family [Consotaella salsifontis]